MCMACDLLRGIDIEALSPGEDAPRYPVHLPDGVGGASLAQWAPDGASPLAGRLRRSPATRSNQHWCAESRREAIAAVAAGSASLPLGYAATAIEDFRQVWQAKLDGRVKADKRFVVAVPTPFTLLSGLGLDATEPERLGRLERQLASELQELFSTVPPEELAIQWDVAAETRVWESRGRDLAEPRELPERLLRSFVALSDAVPAEAELGWHFCHRDSTGRASGTAHDAAQVTRLAGAIIASTDREPAFVHVPVPAGRDDAEYYAPLANLGLWPAMEVYLGLVHGGDDVESAWRRLYAASSVLGRVGVGPACGADPAAVLPVVEQLLARAAADVPAAQ